MEKKSISKRAIIGFDHGLPCRVKNMALGPCFSHGMGDHDQILQPIYNSIIGSSLWYFIQQFINHLGNDYLKDTKRNYHYICSSPRPKRRFQLYYGIYSSKHNQKVPIPWDVKGENTERFFYEIHRCCYFTKCIIGLVGVSYLWHISHVKQLFERCLVPNT